MDKSKIEIGHGAGGLLTSSLIKNVILKHFKSEELANLSDAAKLKVTKNNLAFTTDSYVVRPYFFKNGDIGKLSVCGTVNDLSVSFARPLFLTASFIIAEGFEIENLEKIVESMAQTADLAGIEIVAGDTKVVEKESCDGIFINTAGIGEVIGEPCKIEEDDIVIVSGTLAEHALCVILEREKFDITAEIYSDVAPLNKMIEKLLESGVRICAMRDPTRGGVATSLCELAEQKNCGFILDEDKIPVTEKVRGICEILGFDYLYMANEGKALIIAKKDDAPEALKILKDTEYGKNAAVIGKVTKDSKVVLNTLSGSKRILKKLARDEFPRIC